MQPQAEMITSPLKPIDLTTQVEADGEMISPPRLRTTTTVTQQPRRGLDISPGEIRVHANFLTPREWGMLDGFGMELILSHYRSTSSFATLEGRTRTFTPENWPNIFNGCGKSAERMARAGWVRSHLGSDTTCCVFCDVVMNKWKRYDNPFLEHANKAQGLCPYINRLRTSGPCQVEFLYPDGRSPGQIQHEETCC